MKTESRTKPPGLLDRVHDAGSLGKSPHCSSLLRAPVFTALASQITEFNAECQIQYSMLNVQVLTEQCLCLAMFLLRPQFENKDHSTASLEQDKKATFSPCKI